MVILASELAGLDRELVETLLVADNALGQLSGGRVSVSVVSGLRSLADQKRLFAQGRTAPGPIVTNTVTGSLHLAGRAVDVSFRIDGKRIGVDEISRDGWRAVANFLLSINPRLRWGGNWVSLKGDLSHFEI